MAFPTIPTGGRVVTGVQADASGTRTFPSLSGLTKNTGDLLIAICIAYQTGTGTDAAFSSWGAGFTEFHDSATSTTMAIGCAYKISDGTETGTFTVTQAGAITGHACFILLSIPGAHGTTAPEAGSRASGTSAAADPASFDPSGWGTEDTLWIAVGGSGETSTTGSYTGVASAPANYSDYAQTGISGDVVGGVEGAVAFRQLNAASENVGTFSVDTSNARNAAVVIAIRPVLSVDLVVQNLSSGSSEGNVDLVQQNNLAVQNSNSASTEGNVALVQEHNLVVQNELSASQEDNVTLTDIPPEVNLVVQNLASTSIEENVALVQQHLLTVQSLISGSLESSPALTQQHNLLVQNAFSAVVLSLVNLAGDDNVADSISDKYRIRYTATAIESVNDARRRFLVATNVRSVTDAFLADPEVAAAAGSTVNDKKRTIYGSTATESVSDADYDYAGLEA